METVALVADGTAIGIWSQDAARSGQKTRLGQKNGVVYQWTPKGTRPRQPKDQRYDSYYIFGVVCPAGDKGAAIIMPHATTQAMRCPLDEMSKSVAQGAHGVVLMDRAGWHKADALTIPANLSIRLIPPCSPELNPPLGDCAAITCRSVVENIGQFLRQTYLSNRIFKNHDAIVDACVDACCCAWNKLMTETRRIKSVATRKWAMTGQ